MYKIVDSTVDLQRWHDIKSVAWSGEGYEMEYAKPLSVQMLFYGEDGQAGGTFEFTPYQYSSEYIKDLFDDVVKDASKVVEVDSFAVLPKYRGKLGREIVCMMIAYAEMKGYTGGVGISDPSVFRSFNETYHIPSIQVKEERFYKGDVVIPTYFDFKTVYENKHLPQYAWYKNPIEMKEGAISA